MKMMMMSLAFILSSQAQAQIATDEAYNMMVGDAVQNISRCAAGLNSSGDFYKRHGAKLTNVNGQLVLDFDGEKLSIKGITRLKGIAPRQEETELFLLTPDKEVSGQDFSSLVCIADRKF